MHVKKRRPETPNLFNSHGVPQYKGKSPEAMIEQVAKLENVGRELRGKVLSQKEFGLL